MLKYKFKISTEGIGQEELVWREKYLSPDLSFISGVTSTDYHLNTYDRISVRNDNYGIQSSYKIHTKTVTRQGYVVVKNKPYDIISGKLITYKSNIFNLDGKEVHYGTDDDGDYKCVFINGKYFYEIKPNPTESNPNPSECFMITDFLVEQVNRPIEKTIYTTAAQIRDNKLLLDTIYWIEDGKVNIDGNEYIFSREENGGDGTLRYFENGAPLGYQEIVPEADGIIFHSYSPKDHKEVCKFTIIANDYATCLFDSISCANYYYYVYFKENYLKVRETTSADTKFINENDEEYEDTSNTIMFVCEVPQYVIKPFDKEYEQLKPLLYPIRTYYDGEILTKEKANKSNIFSIQNLYNIYAYIVIEKAEKKVSYDIQNSNNGNSIIAYLANNDDSRVRVNDEVIFYDLTQNSNEELAYSLTEYKGENGDTESFVFYNGKKCKIIKNLCDKALVPTNILPSEGSNIDASLCNEFSINYINGKVDGKDALVDFYDEIIPMQLKEDTSTTPSTWSLIEYGETTYNTCDNGKIRTTNMVYKIAPYDGILVNGKPYALKEKRDVIDENNPIINWVVSVDDKKIIPFTVRERLGSSALVCDPIIPNNLTREFSSYMSKLMTRDVVLNQSTMGMYVKDRVFGDKEITEDSGWEYRYYASTIEDSMLWYYNVKYNPIIIVANGHISIPLNLDVNMANNTLQDDIVNDQFYRVEKEKAINGIVDMEKDVYIPKFISGYYDNDGIVHAYGEQDARMYSGSSTIFNPIYEINLNFHFRTRDLTTWKVNEGYDDAESLSSSTDNWFVTDFHPYKEMIEDQGRGNELMNSSDLMGLLYFTYDDIFYQKSKVAKSFARLLLYDSTDPQTQSLMDMSTVFVDEHSLYKKLIDNSRKNINIFGNVEGVDKQYVNRQGQGNNNPTDNAKPTVAYKITVKSEYLGQNRCVKQGDTTICPEDTINAYTEAPNKWSGVTLDESHRLSSRLTIKNKYQTDTSSEGFYHYIFREYSEDLHPKPLYMKIEFNHAGIGKTIPMLVPMRWGSSELNDDKDPTDYKNLKEYPLSALTLGNNDDVEELKKGIPLSYLYAQSYIPFYAVYDFINKEYAYVIDERYLTEDNKSALHNEGILNIDLFEMKIMNEVEDTPTTDNNSDNSENSNEYNASKDPRKQKVGIININTNMFDKKSFNKEQL